MLKPEPQQNLREVVRRAFDEIAGREPEELARSAGGRLSAGQVIELELLGRTLAVDLGARTVRTSGGPDLRAREVRPVAGDTRAEPVGDDVAAVVARYVMLSGKLPRDGGPVIGFADAADARGYLVPFRGRVIAPLLGKFGRDPEAFARAAEEVGGERVEVEAAGAVAWKLTVLPCVALTFVLYPGDEELPAEGQVLFPRALFEAFAVDDVVAMAELAARALRGRLWLKSPD